MTITIINTIFLWGLLLITSLTVDLPLKISRRFQNQLLIRLAIWRLFATILSHKGGFWDKRPHLFWIGTQLWCWTISSNHMNNMRRVVKITNKIVASVWSSLSLVFRSWHAEVYQLFYNYWEKGSPLHLISWLEFMFLFFSSSTYIIPNLFFMDY